MSHDFKAFFMVIALIMAAGFGIGYGNTHDIGLLIPAVMAMTLITLIEKF